MSDITYLITGAWGPISITCWIHRRQPIARPNGRAMGYHLWIFVRKLIVVTAPHCIFTFLPTASHGKDWGTRCVNNKSLSVLGPHHLFQLQPWYAHHCGRDRPDLHTNDLQDWIHGRILHPSGPCHSCSMMTSSSGNIFRVTGHLCGELTGPRWIPTQRPVTRSFDVFFDLRPNKRLSKQWWGWWFETLSRPLWRHRNHSGWTPFRFYVRSEVFHDVSLMYDKCSSGICLMYDKCSSGICLMFESIRT